jgi:hypothetical protein
MFKKMFIRLETYICIKEGVENYLLEALLLAGT